MVERTGPRLTFAGTCAGCCFYARVTSDESVRICNHEHTAQPHHRIMTTGEPTPAWCPLLPAARLALARGIVAASQPSALDLVPPDEAAIHRRMGSTPIVDPDALFGQELRVYPREEQKR